MKHTLFILLCSSILLGSCWDLRRPINPPEYKVWGYRPVFTIDSTFLNIVNETPRSTKNPAKIYVKGNYIFQNDLGYGVHVIDNSNPSQPQKVGFIRINGNSEMSIKGNYMYANSYSSLVVLDITDWQHVRELKRVPGVFNQGMSAGNAYYYFIPPPEHRVYFACNGVFVQGQIQTGWVRDSISSYSCYYP